MSKTSQEIKAKKAKKIAVEVLSETEGQKAPETVVPETPVEEVVETIKKTTKVRGKKYQSAKKLIDVSKFYPAKEAVELVKKVSISKFEGKIEAHITVIEDGNLGEIIFPHLETATKKIAILNDTILAEIKAGKINFDILIATPITMPKLLPFAKILGPKGLMPNPKSGTLTDKPEDAVKKLSVAKTKVQTEKKSPVVHIVIGKTSQPDTEILANLAELIKVIKPTKIKKLCLCPTMGPSVKVAIEK